MGLDLKYSAYIGTCSCLHILLLPATSKI